MSRNLSREEIVEVVKDLSESVVEDLGLELVDVEYTKEQGQYILRIFVHKKGGLSINDCEKMANIISEKIDEEDPIPGAYYLEVSSPGLDRPIETDADLERNLEEEIEVRLYKNIDGRKVYEGILTSYTDDEVVILEGNGEERIFPRELISLMRLVIKF